MGIEGIWEEVISAKVPVLLEFYADWCGPCKVMGQVVEELRQELEKEIKIIQVNVEKNPDFANRFAVFSLPTFLAYSRGERIGQLTGLQTKEVLLELIKLHDNR